MLKHKGTLVAALALLAGVESVTSAATVTGPITNPANGHNYYLLEQATWTNSQAEAVALGGNLATINNAAENQWVFSIFGSFGGVQRNLWIGYNDAASEGNFVWVSGEAPAYTNWNAGEPNNDPQGIEDWTVITPPAFSPNAVWNDVQNATSARNSASGTFYANHGVVEVVPEPAAVTLFGISGLMLLLRRRSA